MIRYPALIVNGQTGSGKTTTVLEAAMEYRKNTGEEAIFVNDEENMVYLSERVLKRHGIDTKNPSDADKERALEILSNGPHLASVAQLPALLAKLNPTGEAGTQIAIFLDAPSLCSLEMNTNTSGPTQRYRTGVSIQDPLAALVKNYTVHAASIQNYAMPSFN